MERGEGEGGGEGGGGEARGGRVGGGGGGDVVEAFSALTEAVESRGGGGEPTVAALVLAVGALATTREPVPVAEPSEVVHA